MNSGKPTIVFMGTPEFAVPALQELQTTFGVAAVVTVPDKPIGRGLKIQASAVKIKAQELGINKILQPQSLKDPQFEEQLRELKPDVICVIAFKILPRAIYTLANKASFNVHASLLPKFRGAAPINHAIIKGEKETGVTSFVLNDVVDTGTILLQRHVEIPSNCTAGELYEILKIEAAVCAVETTRSLLEESITPTKQDDTLATPAPKVFRETSSIEWNKPAQDVCNYIHGLSPSPCAWTTLQGERIKIFSARTTQCPVIDVGTWQIENNEWLVGTQSNPISLKEIQMPGKAKVKVEDFLRGWRGATRGRFE